MDPKLARCILIGWDMTTKGYHCYNSLTKTILIMWHVKIDESKISTTEIATEENHSTFDFQWNVCSFPTIYIDTILTLIPQIPSPIENYAPNQNCTSLFNKSFSPSCVSPTPFFNLPTQSPFSRSIFLNSIYEPSSPIKSSEQINIGPLRNSTRNKKLKCT